jgi:hypothetical protein
MQALFDLARTLYFLHAVCADVCGGYGTIEERCSTFSKTKQKSAMHD